ncbi:DUF5677 domain-containing protein [Marinobacter nauticus]|uniref:DUF5677 domain-containing protein n=1 Tax=Marinobacter nauticus TaxID=2743 RepID=UPI001D18AE5A|nr:DUF5677 domain-containing protein [Marinobacter nauticus]MCC4269087.1 DUF5677 domain-containing protein [Marinobacter nauticus]
MVEANEIGHEYLSDLSPKDDAQNFTIYTHINLIGRIFEQVEGMLSCIATRNHASAEALARVVVEGSTNLMYFSFCGNEKSIISFMAMWVSEHKRKLAEWKDYITDKDANGTVVAMINKRLEAVNLYEEFVEHGLDKFSVEKNEFPKLWPKSIFRRFQALGQESSYYTNYHRLSGSSHITAEDTILWLMSIGMGDEDKCKIGQETLSYSIMMTRISSMSFIDGVAFSCIHHGLEGGEQLNRLLKLKGIIEKTTHEIAEAAGVPKI